nr:MAG TPA: hypothetical protein [Caudoviricetes sp.]
MQTVNTNREDFIMSAASKFTQHLQTSRLCF